NAAAERLKGWKADEIIGQHFSRFYPEEELQAGRPAKELETAAQLGRYEEEVWRGRKDGTRVRANVLMTALRDENGKLRGFGKVTRDLTERNRAESWFRDFIESAPDAVVIINRAGDIVLVNGQTEKLFGYARGELLGRPVEMLVPARAAGDHARLRDGY